MNSTRAAASMISTWGLAIATAFLAPLFIYFDTARSIVSIWNSSETFAHGYIIVPIAIWLIWQRRQTITGMVPMPWWPALPLLAICGFGWLLAELAGVQVVRQYAFVAMVPIISVLVLGLRISRALAFPLFFLLLAVPFGEVFIDPLIRFTADFTVAALHLTGIPVLRDGTNFVIPSGSWSVVTACSGVRYLIASVTLGCLYAYLTYKSRFRQVMFIILSIVVPILANGLRAYMIVMIGHLSGMTLAVGVDHIIYGWAFFGLVMLLMFWIGSFWREDLQLPKAGAVEARPFLSGDRQSKPNVLAAAFSAIVCLTLWPMYAHYINQKASGAGTATLSSFKPEWQESKSFTPWKPRFFPANAELRRFYRQGDQSVGMSILYYRNQNRGSMLISSTNQLVTEEDQEWRRLGSSVRTETVSGLQLPMRESRIEGPSGPMLVWTWNWIDGKFTVNDYLGKLLQAKEKLLMRGDDGAAIIVFAPYAENPDEARSAMRNFLTVHRLSLQAVLDANKKNE